MSIASEDARAVEIGEPDVSDDAITLVMARVRCDSLSAASASMPPPPLAPPAMRPARRSIAALAFLAGLGVGVLGLSLTRRPSPPPLPADTAQAAAQPSTAPPPAAEVAPIPQPVVVDVPRSAEAPRKQAPARAATTASPPVETAAPLSTADFPDPAPVIPPAPKPAGTEIDRSAVAVAIASVGIRAGACREEGTGAIAVPVSITFLPSGRAARATVNGGPYAGSAVGSCIALALREASVPPFDGEAVNVSTTLHLR
jgi:hypothetical protein